MAEVLAEYEPILEHDGTAYTARAIGRPAADGMWEAWLEFIPAVDSAPVLVGPVESRQPHREHLAYWASGLSRVYLEGALARAAQPTAVAARTVAPPYSDRPASSVAFTTATAARREAVIDPFEIGGRSLDILRQELTAFNRPRLLDIISAFDLNPAGEDLSWLSDAQLVHFIVVAVDTQLPQRLRS